MDTIPNTEAEEQKGKQNLQVLYCEAHEERKM